MSSYDHVVVGGGSAGCVLAARLTEDPDVRVLLLEAGPADTALEVHVPAAFGQLLKSDLDWDLGTEPEDGLNGRRVYLPRGRVLGGSSSMNAMIYMRGNRLDYDGWAAETGDDRWSYEQVLPYFRRSEDNERGADEHHGAGGPLSVQEGRSQNPLTDRLVAAAVSAGHSANADFNGAEQDGFGRFQLTQNGGMRCSAAKAFLHPVLDRPNLTVLTDARAHRILIEQERAVGVVYERHGSVEEVRVEGEVLLAAGAYLSPQLLMLSGIGVADELAPLGIASVADLPVGKGLEDHLTALFTYLTDEETLMTALTPDNMALLEQEGRGPLTSNVAEGGGFFRTRPDLDAPDMQVHLGPAMFHQEGLGALTDHALVVGPCLLTPRSRGEVTLRGPLAIAKPRVRHAYLTEEPDRQAFYEGMRTVLGIMEQPDLQDVVRGPHDVPASDSDADLQDWLERRAHTLYHPTSTCAMGRVLDSELRVLGIDGLRVVDASAMPHVPRGNTNAPTIMLAERAADLVRGTAPTAGASADVPQALGA